LAPGSRANGTQGAGFGALGDQLRTGGGARSASPHHVIRSPFEDTGISLELSHVMSNMSNRCKSADPVGMGVSALNNHDGDDDLSDDDRNAHGEYRVGSGFGASSRNDDDYCGSGPSFDLDRLTLPPGMQRGNAHGDGMPDQPGSQSMLQPMSPGQPSSDGGSMFGQVHI